jgi:oxygen-independent coproporphyrinogen-3 oxidase
MELRRNYLGGETIQTLYLGGGTPSLLAAADLERLFKTLDHIFPIAHDAEVTMEANPDDLTPAYLRTLRALPVNRLSIGIQSFDDEELRFLHRRHDSRRAIEALEACREAGFENLSIDLIFGLPGQALARWASNLKEALRLDVPHISAYGLTYEKHTTLYRLLQAGRLQAVDEALFLEMFSLLMERMETAGYEHYEISNFARPGRRSRHNSSYWTGDKYLGLGPAAHSYDGGSRQWNVSALLPYLSGMAEAKPVFEKEILTPQSLYNDYVLTRLRRCEGISPTDLVIRFGKGALSYCMEQAAPYLKRGLLTEKGGTLHLTREGIFLADEVISDLLWLDSATKPEV